MYVELSQVILLNGGEQIYNWDFLALIEIITNACLLLIETPNKICSWILFILLENRVIFFVWWLRIFFTSCLSLIFQMHFFDLLKQVGAPARVGLVAPIDVVVPPGNTGLDPSQTSFFQVCHLYLMMIMFVLVDFGIFFVLQFCSFLVLAVFLLTLIAALFFSTGAQYSNQD